MRLIVVLLAALSLTGCSSIKVSVDTSICPMHSDSERVLSPLSIERALAALQHVAQVARIQASEHANLFIVPCEHDDGPLAFTTWVSNDVYVISYSVLARDMTETELLGVSAHELGHVHQMQNGNFNTPHSSRDVLVREIGADLKGAEWVGSETMTSTRRSIPRLSSRITKRFKLPYPLPTNYREMHIKALQLGKVPPELLTEPTNNEE